MTPTLFGRWQTRVILIGTIGVLITLAFALSSRSFFTPFVVLFYATLLGLGWDLLYNFLQKLRWDRDWPPIFFLFGAIIEALFLWNLIYMLPLPGIERSLTFVSFISHYTVVWLAIFALMLGPLRVLLLHWRFQGAEWWRRI